MASKQRILIVDDDENIAELISLYLTKECYETKIVYDGESALSELSVFKPNLILLDLMLPGIDGYQVCREIRKNNNVPIIMLSAKGETFDKVLGLELGADDYIIKPFETKEMVARVKAVLRRYHMPQSIGVDSSNAKCVNYPDLSINLDNYSVNYMGKNVEMPPKELELLYFLASAPNQVFTREQLLDNIWGYEYIGDTRTVDTIKSTARVIHTLTLQSISTSRTGAAKNPVLRDYYLKKCSSKPKLVAMGAVSHKVRNIIYAILRDSKSFEIITPQEHIKQYNAAKCDIAA